MMNRREIDVADLSIRAHHLWANQWLLLTSGDFTKKDFNTMTVGWGSLGTMWGKPFAQVVVRPSRHTYSFTERYDSFTLCVFPESFNETLLMLGSKSGRDGDKIAESGLTAIPSMRVAAPGFEEAELILECKKLYWDDLEPSRFLDPGIEANYPQKDYHRVYFGEIVGVWGVEQYERRGE
jgi:flavin reductase (DIM6/NTAB) family NADH-FMN oxidoreductase RutF